jgi:hypothetical protein
LVKETPGAFNDPVTARLALIALATAVSVMAPAAQSNSHSVFVRVVDAALVSGASPVALELGTDVNVSLIRRTGR